MNRVKPMVGLEFTDKYEKAKQDLTEARKSFSELTPDQKRNLVNELFGAEAVASLCQVMQKYFE